MNPQYFPELEDELNAQYLREEPSPFEQEWELKIRAFERGDSDRFKINKVDFYNVADLVDEMPEAKETIEFSYAKGYNEDTNARDLGISDKALR